MATTPIVRRSGSMLIYGPDVELARRAEDVRSKISAVLPTESRSEMDAVGLFAIPNDRANNDKGELAQIRSAIRAEIELDLHYTDKSEARTQRRVWPIALGYVGPRQMLLAWCTLREDFRRFWVDRIDGVAETKRKYPKPRRTLLHEWQKQENSRDLR